MSLLSSFNNQVSDSQQSGQTFLDTLTNRYILKASGKATFGINGFVFDREGEQRHELRSDITDHYVEDNTAVQDHISLHPERITLRGFVCELKLAAPTGLSGIFNTINNKFGQASAYLGKYTPGIASKIKGVINQAQQVVNKVNDTINRASNLVGMFRKAAPAITKQQQAYELLSALRSTRTTFMVQTPYGYFLNYVIENLIFIQPDDTKYWSDISVTLKEIRTAATEAVTISASSHKGRALSQQAEQVNNGATKGTPVQSSSLLSKLTGIGK